MKSEAEVDRPKLPPVDQICRAKEPGDRVLPLCHKAANDGFQLRIPRIIRRSAPQNQANEIGGREVELFATIDPILLDAGNEQIVEVSLQPNRMVYAVEKTRRFTSIVEIRRKHVVDRRIELQKPDFGAGAVVAFAHTRGAWQRGQRRQ